MMRPMTVLLTVWLLAACGPDIETPPVPRPADLERVGESRLKQAVQADIKALEDDPDSPEAWGRLGMRYRAHDWYQEAAVCLRHAIRLDPGAMRWHYYLGRSLESLEPDKAAAAFGQALRLAPEYAPVHVYLARVLRRLGKLNQAKAHFERAGELEPGNPDSSLALGQLAAAEGDLEQARSHLNRALDLNPEQSEAHAQLARVLMGLGERDRAKRHAEQARRPTRVEPMPDPVWGELQLLGVSRGWYARRGNFYLLQGLLDRALAELEVAVENDQPDAEIWLNYGTALLRAERFADARAALEQALSRTERPDSEVRLKILLNLGVACSRLGEPAAATAHLSAAHRDYPDSIDAARNLAIAYHAQGRLREAAEALAAAGAIRPDAGAAQALAKLRREIVRPPNQETP
jgi:tetratricopeptide (TPR) repeat protein